MPPSASPANQAALARMLAVVPRFTAVGSARDLLGLGDRVLLHAGPPLADPTRPPPPLRHAAVLGCLHEGWAADPAAAAALIAGGQVRLEPALAHRASTPLVATIGPRTTLAVIDAGAGCEDTRWHGFLGTGAGAQLRFGAPDPAILERLAFREHTLLPGFTALLEAGPVDLLSIARSALTEGDDLHNRLSSATAVLAAVLESRRVEAPQASATVAAVREALLYFLNLWMPACALVLDAATGVPGATLLTRLAANGEVCGIQLAGLPGRWFTAPASPVRGPFMKGAPEHPQFPPATGDSGIIDAFGLGGQALRRAPSLVAAFAPWLAPDDSGRALGMLAGWHPALGIEFAVDAAAVVASGRAPLLSTGMVSADGRGLLGRGLCEMPLAPFTAAIMALGAGPA